MPIYIPDEFVDVDLDAEAKRLNLGTGNAGSGLLFGAAPVFEDSIPMIPESQWKTEIDKIDQQGGIERLITRIYNQKQEGSCVSNATGQAHEIIQAAQHGKDKVVPLSAISLYKRCGRSPGSGSTVSGNLEELATRGILPLDTPENRAKYKHVMPNTGFSLPYPDGWQETAAQFRGIEWFDVRSVAGMITALILGYPVVVGRQGHSICYVRPQYRNGQLGVIYVNSWDDTWGFSLAGFSGGFGFDTPSQIRQSASWAFALRSVNTISPFPPVLA